MPGIQIINNTNDIHLAATWRNSPKFTSKNRIVDEQGLTWSVGSDKRRYMIVSKNEREFSCLERVGRVGLGILAVLASFGCALLSKYVCQLFTAEKEKVRFAIPYNQPIGEQEPTLYAYDTEYDLDFAVKTVEKLSQELPARKMKLCLFIGRTPGEPFPGLGQDKPEDEIWVSLDREKVSLEKNDDAFLPGKQLHLQINMNDTKTLQRIHKLFDKVLVDQSTIKFCDVEKNPWYVLGRLLRPTEDAQLIAECRISSTYLLDEIQPLMAPEDRGVYRHQLAYQKSYPQARDQWEDNCINARLDTLNRDNCFSSIKLQSSSPFPYAYRPESPRHHFIFKGPQPKLWH